MSSCYILQLIPLLFSNVIPRRSEFVLYAKQQKLEMGAGERHQAPILTCILIITYKKDITIAKIFLDNFYCSYAH